MGDRVDVNQLFALQPNLACQSMIETRLTTRSVGY
jgi:hypothetical protein